MAPPLVRPFAVRRTIRFHDTDRAGMVFHGAFVTYFQDSFEDLMREIGHPERDLEAALGVRLPVVHLKVDFRAHPVGDQLEVAIHAAAIGRTSVTFRIDARDTNGTLVAEAEVVRVCIDAHGRAVPVPDALRHAWTDASGAGDA